MASPFTVFRKHQKVFLAVLALLAMIAFVFLSGPVFDALTSGNVQNPVVVRTKAYGDLTELELSHLLRQQNLVRTFFERVYWTLGFRLPVEPPSEESAVETWLLANRARELGMVISNQMINTYIQEMTGKRVSRDTLRQVLREMHVTDRQLFEALRTELAARQMLELIDFSTAPTTPAQRWDYYQRLNRRATVELVAEPVAKYVDRVGEPEEATLRDFFEKYKENYYDPTSPDPGFRRPHRVVVEYLKAEIAQFLEPSSITDEQIQQYYEKHKDTYYLRSTLPPVEKAGAQSPPAESQSPPESKPETTPSVTPEPKQPSLSKPTASPPAGKEPVESLKPPEEKLPKQSSKEEKPSESDGVENADPAKKAPEVPPSSLPKGDGSASRTDPIDASWVSLAFGAGRGSLQEVQPALWTVSAEGQTQASEPADAPSAAGTQPDGKPAESGASAPSEKPSEKPSESTPASLPSGGAGGSSAPASKYVPLEEVREEIREALARGQAQAKIEQMLQKIRDQMNSYSQSRLAALAAGTQPPQPLNLQALANQYGLQYRKTPLVAEWQLRRDFRDLAQSQVAGRESVLRVLYYQGRPPLQPMLAQDPDAYYLFWKLEDVKEAIASWDYAEAERLEKEAQKARHQGQEQEAAKLAQQAQRARKETDQLRQEVLRAWKMSQARSLARDRAAQLAALARKSGKPLQEALAKEPGVTVLEAGPFSWLTHGGISPRLFVQAPPPRISSIPQVELPGEEFMQTVFRMEPGQVEVAFNQPQTVAYVIRVKSFEPSDEVLWKMFLAEPYADYSTAAVFDQQKIRRAWLEQLKQQIGFRWERKPHPAAER